MRRPRPASLRGVWLALPLVAAVLFPACYITTTLDGEPLPDASTLEVGRSTKADALARLGPPLTVRRQFDGDLLTWRRSAGRLETLRIIPLIPLYERTWGKGDADILTLLFNREGVLAGSGTQLDIKP